MMAGVHLTASVYGSIHYTGWPAVTPSWFTGTQPISRADVNVIRSICASTATTSSKCLPIERPVWEHNLLYVHSALLCPTSCSSFSYFVFRHLSHFWWRNSRARRKKARSERQRDGIQTYGRSRGLSPHAGGPLDQVSYRGTPRPPPQLLFQTHVLPVKL